MIKNIMRLFAVIVVLLLPIGAFSADIPKFRFITSIYTDSKGDSLKQPEGVACNYKSLVVVADTGKNRLIKYTFSDGSLQGGDELPVSGLSNPLRVQVNSKGEIFALDGKERRIARISREGALMGYVTPQGLPAPPDFIPRSFRIDGNDAIYIIDIFNARVLVLDPSMKFIRLLPFPDNYGFISDLAVNAQGTIFLIDSVNSVVYSADKNASGFAPLTKPLKENIAFAANIALDNNGTIYLADQNSSTIVTINKDGSFQTRHLSMGWKDGMLHYPTQMCITNSGDMFIADRDNNRIGIFNIVQ
ncbi:MAG: NHL repeat-containing protein [Dissulfurispiraceae bacterium]